jgi:hypothetical protein
LHEHLDLLQARMNKVGIGIQEAFFAARVVPPRARPRPQPRGLTMSQSISIV